MQAKSPMTANTVHSQNTISVPNVFRTSMSFLESSPTISGEMKTTTAKEISKTVCHYSQVMKNRMRFSNSLQNPIRTFSVSDVMSAMPIAIPPIFNPIFQQSDYYKYPSRISCKYFLYSSFTGSGPAILISFPIPVTHP